jgi:hypothetical protein
MQDALCASKRFEELRTHEDEARKNIFSTCNGNKARMAISSDKMKFKSMALRVLIVLVSGISSIFSQESRGVKRDVSPSQVGIPNLYFGATVIDNNGQSELFANVTSEKSGSSVFRKKGSYYLKINAANCNWKIVVQEYQPHQ